MRVTTRCRTVDELIAAFSPHVDEETILVLTDDVRPVGMRRRFAIELDDGRRVMRGEVQVIEATPPPSGRLRLRILDLDDDGRALHARMLARRTPTESRLPTVDEFDGAEKTPLERPGVATDRTPPLFLEDS